jgi:hypothetical protein
MGEITWNNGLASFRGSLTLEGCSEAAAKQLAMLARQSRLPFLKKQRDSDTRGALANIPNYQ